MEGRLERCLGSSCKPGQCLYFTDDMKPTGRIFMSLKCFVLSLVIVVVISRLYFYSDHENFCTELFPLRSINVELKNIQCPRSILLGVFPDIRTQRVGYSGCDSIINITIYCTCHN
ncbi:hypothetical protein TNCV_1169341 [Trichonephila clavipes]|uniref:Uncharacterized protein n=1 Tax=Trichonephila clavipes TaxID=2585209 RepID=A0A8X6T181_TRICX|nr:hypothetical protein TNCV_1169341 [Trichonephila clavipes]